MGGRQNAADPIGHLSGAIAQTLVRIQATTDAPLSRRNGYGSSSATKASSLSGDRGVPSKRPDIDRVGCIARIHMRRPAAAVARAYQFSRTTGLLRFLLSVRPTATAFLRFVHRREPNDHPTTNICLVTQASAPNRYTLRGTLLPLSTAAAMNAHRDGAALGCGC
jgi:hypothetical protein